MSIAKLLDALAAAAAHAPAQAESALASRHVDENVGREALPKGWSFGWWCILIVRVSCIDGRGGG
ncbi:hypothetical protein HO173_005524 [Letharia columbiana]|uniref:Uncharacterized protein n=1 Tax=Letharia columbiana TaxID=112416 RepID=A0A8H6L5I3_9LECA|nr:uncharacterized protein HO173_005524 [Letharia columbiana]KAF6236272.1 hypothetical protein HO173_005524 [Letharia columbiana]